MNALKKKRILLFSEGFGSGHTQAAGALAEGLRQADGVRTRILELGAFQHPTLAPLIFKAYRKTVTSRPRLYGMLYRTQEEKTLNRLTSMALHRIFYARTLDIIRQLRPDLIVCTHPFPSAVVSRLKRAGLSIPLIGVITDYAAHGTWIDAQVDKYLVPAPHVKTKMVEGGVPAGQISVTGIPVHPKFWVQQDRKEVRGYFGLRDMPTLLVMGGGWGLLSVGPVMDELTNWRDRVQLLICLGSNDKARQKLAEDERYRHPNIRLFGFTKEVDKLMDAADMLFTKPGGMTCTEGIAKGIPMLFYDPIPGQEEENCHYFVQNGFGERIDSIAALNGRLQELVDDYPAAGEIRFQSRTTRRPPEFDPQQGIVEILSMLP